MKKNGWRLFGVGLLLSGLTSQVWSSKPETLPSVPQSDQEVIARFKAADLNGDGKVTREEAEKGLPRVAMVWDKVDVDRRGYITLEQLQILSNANK